MESADIADIADILESLARAIRASDRQQLRTLRERVASLSSRNGWEAKPRSKGVPIDRKRLGTTHKKLVAARTREDGLALLETEDLTRAELVALAKAADVHVTKSDGVSRIEEKLVEALIGSRLSSEAIRGS
jgi:hypothetical protein